MKEAVATGLPLRVMFALSDDADAAGWAALSGVELVVVSPAVLDRLSSTQSPQSPVAVMMIPHRPLSTDRSVLVPWEISDPGNLGTIIRAAAAFGFDAGIGPGCADPWSPKALRSGAGGHFRTGVASIELEGITTVAAVVSGGVPPEAMPPGRLAILIGGEARGLPEEVSTAADVRVTIPMTAGSESLNAAMAAAILAYVLAQRSRKYGGLEAGGR